MPDDTVIRPYGQAALTYWAAGWRGVLPVGNGPEQKSPVPIGYTGAHADDPSRADVQAWLDGPEAARNIGLRLPPGVLGLDVDAYGEKRGGQTLDALVERWGPLPPTWVTSARDDGISGIRLFRVPAELGGRHWPGEAGPNIEIIQTGHRYAVVWPSVNPDAAGAMYRWRMEIVGGPPVCSPHVPTPDELPWLPAAWVDGLALTGETAQKSDMALGDLADWWRTLADGPPCGAVLKVLAGVDWAAGSRHETARDAARALAAYGGEGHPGAVGALRELERGFVRAVGADRGSDAARAEWARLLVGAVRLAARATPVPRERDPCEVMTGVGVTFAPPMDFSGASTPPDGSTSTDVEALSTNASAQVDGLSTSMSTVSMPPDLLAEMRGKLVRRDGLDALPDPQPLIWDILDQDSESWIIGAAGGFKSFVALDMAGHVATGRPWRGHRVERGGVVYLVAEGAKGIRKRIRAWEATYEQRLDDLVIYPEPVQVINEYRWAVFVQLCVELAPRLVVLDTQARITVGLNENDNGQMGTLTEAVRKLRVATGACVLVVHHTGRAGGDARGASAIDGAQDTELKVERPTARDERLALTATVRLDKQKDDSEAADMEIKMRVVELGEDPLTGRRITSLAIEPMDPFGQPGGRVRPAPDWEQHVTDNQADVVAAFRAHSDEIGATRAQGREWVRAHRQHQTRPDMPGTSYDSAVRDLVSKGIFTRLGTSRVSLTELLPSLFDDFDNAE